MKILVLKTVCWMNPWTVVEHIPADWTKLSIAIYHNYTQSFHMNNNLNVKIVPMSRIEDEKIPWTQVWTTPWPLPGWQEKPRDQIIREHVTTLEVPEELRSSGPYALHLEVHAASGDWKSGWMFEGIGLVKAD